MPNHAAGTVVQGGSTDIQFFMGDPAPVYFDLWYSDSDRFDVTINTPDGQLGPFTSPVSNGDYDYETNVDVIYYQLGSAQNFFGSPNEREIWIEVTGTNGFYDVSLQGSTVVNGAFNASLNPSFFWDPSGVSNYFTTSVAPGGTIWDLASSSNDICPNDYVHRTNWVDINGFDENNAGQGGIGELWLGTGIGPTYDGRVGIDVSAPGDSVFTTYNTNSYWETFQFNLIQDGHGRYGRASATSAANPMVTGIIALMLQMNPQLDAAMVKRILHQSARADAFTGAVPNNSWGYGKVDAYAAMTLVQQTLPLLSVTLTNRQPLLVVQRAIAGKDYVLQFSPDLHSWTSMLTNTATTNVLSLVDVDPLAVARFYRVVQRP